MKTKLLLLFLVVTAFANAQFNKPILTVPTVTNITTTSATINYSVLTNGFVTNCNVNYSLVADFNPLVGSSPYYTTFYQQNYFQTGNFSLTGLSPGTLYYVRVNAIGQGTTIETLSFTTTGTPPVTTPTLSGVSSQLINSTSTSIAYTLNANNEATTSVINYGLTSGDLTSQIAGFSASGNTTISNSVTLSGLSANTTYYYQIVAINSAGTTPSSIGSFTAGVQAVTPAVAEYNFDGTLNNIYGNTPFSNASSNVFGSARNGNPNEAIYMEKGNMLATIANLPSGSNARTVSLWIKPITIKSDNIVFAYGNLITNNAYGFSFKTTTINNFAWANDLTGNVTIPANVWKHIVCTYNTSGQATVYINGISVLTGSKPTWNTSSGTDFTLRGFDGYVDDLKIYNYELSQADISSLYTTNSLSSQDFNQSNLEVSLYPNPANDVLNIEMTNEVKSVEIFNLQGQKVITANQKQINIENLASGMYLVNITDVNNFKIAKKIIKE